MLAVNKSTSNRKDIAAGKMIGRNSDEEKNSYYLIIRSPKFEEITKHISS